eukprot:5750582-Heterocapsa_arctica.AAC.1
MEGRDRSKCDSSHNQRKIPVTCAEEVSRVSRPGWGVWRLIWNKEDRERDSRRQVQDRFRSGQWGRKGCRVWGSRQQDQ